MNRVEIKELAKEKIKGNIWNILWPLLLIAIVFSTLSNMFGPKYSFNPNTYELVKISGGMPVISTLITLAQGIVMACYLKYILDFVRTGNFNSSTIIDTLKAKWKELLIATLVGTIVIAIGFVLLIIPGIIMALAYSMAMFIIVDNDISGSDALKASKEMMRGHKLDYFIFGLSFIGWFLLVPFTLGLLLIWLIPYMTVANTLFYERLKENR